MSAGPRPAPPAALDRAGLRALLAACEAAARAHEAPSAFARLRVHLVPPGAALTLDWRETIDVLADVTRANGWRGLARALVAVREADRPPFFGKAAFLEQSAAQLEDVAMRFIEQGDLEVAESFFAHAAKAQPGRAQVHAATLAAARAKLVAEADARAEATRVEVARVQAAEAARAVGDAAAVRIARARHRLFAADLVGAERALGDLASDATLDGDLAEVAQATAAMLSRARALVAAGRPPRAVAEDPRGLVAIAGSAVLLDAGDPEAPATLAAVLAQIDALGALLRHAATAPHRVRAMPGRDSKVLAAITARRLALPLVDDDRAPGEGDLLVCYALGRVFGDEGRLAARGDAAAWVHALPDDAPMLGADVIGRLGVPASAPWDDFRQPEVIAAEAVDGAAVVMAHEADLADARLVAQVLWERG